MSIVNHLFTYLNKEKKEYWIRIGVRSDEYPQ